ncbi:DUF2334 domain-containing protein [Paenibacillus whitsoniae]|uniref:DUF2334 domain-containing protein n=2 Tax=Paenibacillus whitsoniae TaxID=2496558 RepID=A0A430J7I8_9BACL|nr:DUF2334 domain-containing protein [Paenibacillus whitsoniae]
MLGTIGGTARMRRRFRLWKQIGIGICGGLIGTIALTFTPATTEQNTTPNVEKRHVMIRLEDVGLGGDYNSPEGLGKLRAVFEYLASEHVPYHVAVIPRRISMKADGVWKERGIDDPNPDPLVSAFIKVLQDAQRNGGVLGMHGYRHQYGESYRADGEHNSGIGSEFNVQGAPETMETSYAAERMKDALAAFAKAGLQPAFWESPHYQDTRGQEEVFRSFVGLLYQPDMHSKNSLKDLVTYDTVNTYGQKSLGSVYVPAPFKYVSDSLSVDQMLDRARTDDGLASFYFHPFLEFSHLEQVKGTDGAPVVRDGLPAYAYRQEEDPSYLHKLMAGFQERGYRWMSLYDVVPFTPGSRVTLPPKTPIHHVLVGDVTGKGHADVVVREAHRILVIPGNYTPPRNRTQEGSQVWLQEAYAPEEQLVLLDVNADGKQDLLAYNAQTGAVRVALSDGQAFLPPEDMGAMPPGLTSLKALQLSRGKGLIAKGAHGLVQAAVSGKRVEYADVSAALPEDAAVYTGRFDSTDVDDVLCVSGSDRKLSLLAQQRGGGFAPPRALDKVSVDADSQVLVGDADGDGRSDVILYNAATGVWRVLENEGGGSFRPLDNAFGPWAQGAARQGLAADWDGNGKADIASYDEAGHVLDMAMSFRGATR